jgi:TPR repeat protein
MYSGRSLFSQVMDFILCQPVTWVCLLGQTCREGTGVPQDYAAAMSWYQKAADQGNAPARFNLGFIYFNGLGVPQDYAVS